MTILEFGDPSKRKIILIHGFQSPWQVWNKYIEHYKEDFHILVPIIPGHDTNQREDFISLSKAAEEIEEYCLSRCWEEIYAVFGMSMGGALAAVIWQNGKVKFSKVIFDGSPLVSVNGFIKQFMVRFYLNVTHKSQQRDKKTVEQAADSIIPREYLDDFLQVLDNMSDATIVNCINSIADFKLRDNIDTKNTEIYYFHGTAANEMLAKKTAVFIAKNYAGSVIKCFKGKSHCENALFHPELMIEELDKALLNKNLK